MRRDRLRSNVRISCPDFGLLMAILAAVFTLIVWAIPQPPHHGMIIQIPRAHHALPFWEANRDDALLVVVAHDGRIFFDRQMASPEMLTAGLRKYVRSGAPKRVFIQADRRAPYHSITTVLDSIGAAGLSEVAFITE